VVGAETNNMLRLAIRVCHDRRNVADRDAIARSRGSSGLGSILLSQFGMNREVADHLAVETALVLQALGGRAVAKIVVTRKSGRAGKVRITSPHGIVFFEIRV